MKDKDENPITPPTFQPRVIPDPPAEGTTTPLPPLPPQSWLIRDESIESVREYGYMEYFCNNTDHVADTSATFRFNCPSSGVFPDIYEYPVKEYDGNYSARFKP